MLQLSASREASLDILIVLARKPQKARTGVPRESELSVQRWRPRGGLAWAYMNAVVTESGIVPEQSHSVRRSIMATWVGHSTSARGGEAASGSRSIITDAITP